MKKLAAKRAVRERVAIVQSFLRHGSYQKVAREHHVSRGVVYYYVQKFLDPNFHNMRHGGYRHSKIKQNEIDLVNRVIFILLKLKPYSSLADVRECISHVFSRFVLFVFISIIIINFITLSDIGYSTVGKILRRMGWSWKVPCKFQIYKYTPTNLM